jgi:hypothetical protein
MTIVVHHLVHKKYIFNSNSMANINKQITLTEKGGAAGPYFDVYYSTDCSTYTISSDGSNVYLPSIGSNVIVTVPDTSICIKLVNKSNVDICKDNSVISGSNPFTTTTTTTASPTTTTTSTTTVAPTTTTTTIACYSCGDGNIRFETSSTSNGSYPTKDVCSTSNQCGTFVYDAIDRPNRFNLYDSSGLIGTSGWVGYASYAGPWGSSLSVTPNGSFTYQFNSTSGRYVLVEYGNADPLNPISDAADWSLTCGTCPTTTTTTTTSTTTTTTTAAPTCYIWESTTCPGTAGCEVQYLNCAGTPVTQSVPYQQSTGQFCASIAETPRVTKGIFTLSQGSACS